MLFTMQLEWLNEIFNYGRRLLSKRQMFVQTIKRSKGLGDTIAKVTKATGLDKVAKSMAQAAGKSDCGCDKRRDTLNRVFPYNR